MVPAFGASIWWLCVRRSNLVLRPIYHYVKDARSNFLGKQIFLLVLQGLVFVRSNLGLANRQPWVRCDPEKSHFRSRVTMVLPAKTTI